MSAIAPAGSVIRNIGAIVAACSSETWSGARSSDVINQPAVVSYIAMPVNAMELTAQMAAKAGWEKAPSHEAGLAEDCSGGRISILCAMQAFREG